ncbi:MAG: serine/threonine protein kinase [Thermoguttaceae bacterium]|nr:serine/threonine protein kinase [Thermoguttaceae bacterium]
MAFTSVDSYRFINRICVGAMTQIWHGFNTQLDIPVAIRMPIDELKQDRKTLSLLRHEYSIGKDIHHEKIVKMHDFLMKDGEQMIVMEWLPFRGLHEILREGLDSYGWRVPQIMLDISESVSFFNSLGWVHCDLSPGVFMVEEETNETKLIEFPFARRRSGGWARLFGAGDVPQHGRYLSPEQIRGEALDQRSDTYSLACVLFEIATGVPPYPGSNFNELIHQHLNLPVPFADSVNSQVTPEFSRLLNRAMSKRACDRPAATVDFFNLLKETRIFKRTPARPSKNA